MSGFHVGQHVLCIEDEDPNDPPPYVQKGRVYTISEMNWYDETQAEEPGLLLQFVEIRNEGVEGVCVPGWDACGFRPLDEKRLDVFRKLLAPRPRERAKA